MNEEEERTRRCDGKDKHPPIQRVPGLGVDVGVGAGRQRELALTVGLRRLHHGRRQVAPAAVLPAAAVAAAVAAARRRRGVSVATFYDRDKKYTS